MCCIAASQEKPRCHQRKLRVPELAEQHCDPFWLSYNKTLIARELCSPLELSTMNSLTQAGLVQGKNPNNR